MTWLKSETNALDGRMMAIGALKQVRRSPNPPKQWSSWPLASNEAPCVIGTSLLPPKHPMPWLELNGVSLVPKGFLAHGLVELILVLLQPLRLAPLCLEEGVSRPIHIALFMTDKGMGIGSLEDLILEGLKMKIRDFLDNVDMKSR